MLYLNAETDWVRLSNCNCAVRVEPLLEGANVEASRKESGHDINSRTQQSPSKNSLASIALIEIGELAYFRPLFFVTLFLLGKHHVASCLGRRERVVVSTAFHSARHII